MTDITIIFTKEDKKYARKHLPGFRQSYLIDARELVLEFDYKPGTTISSSQDYIINKEIEKRLEQALANRKSRQIIYFHYEISVEFVKNIKAFFRRHGARPKFVLLDPRGEFRAPVKRHFDEVVSHGVDQKQTSSQ